ncbi:MAG: insulinase family protein [Treponema sp.]|nr:insulinase family protein [Treponema sp.]
MKKLDLCACIFLFTAAFCAFPQTSIDEVAEKSSVSMMTLPNGLSLFVKEDFSSALVHAEFMCRAGYSAQTPSTTGFLPLYTSLFSTTKSEYGEELFSDIELLSSCNAESSTYTADFTREKLSSFLRDISRCAQSPSFSDEAISSKYNALKSEVGSYSSSVAGFINGAIESRIFSSAPWKMQSGIYPALFSNLSVPELRAILQDIGSRFYTPDNSALFITGNISAKDAYTLAEKYFSSWRTRYSGPIPRTGDAFSRNQISSKRKFVIADSSFSGELTQLVVQFTSLSSVQSDLIAAAFNADSSSFKKMMISDSLLAIRSKGYMNAASVRRGVTSRFVIQALMESPYSLSQGPVMVSNANPVTQTETFLLNTKLSSRLSSAEFSMAQNAVSAQYQGRMGTSVKTMQLLADTWAEEMNPGSIVYYEDLLSSVNLPYAENAESLFVKICAEDPYVFVLVNPAVYEKYKNDFDERGYSLITRESGSWYQDNLTLARALEKEKINGEKQARISLSGVDASSLSPANQFYFVNSTQMKSSILENGIPLLVKENPESQTVCISLSIAGGEAASPKKEPLLRTVLVNAFARTLQDEINSLRADGKISGDISIRAKTEQIISYVNVDCVKSDFDATMTAMLKALVYGEITPVTADRLVNEQKAEWSSHLMLLDSQMEYNALKYLFRNSDSNGSAYSVYYDQNVEVLSETSLHSITKAYTEFLDAALYSFVIAGGVDSKTAHETAEKTFGLLREQTERRSAVLEVPLPVFKNKTRRVQLRHLYTTTKTKEQAGTEVPVLIPTSEFYDPAHYYLPVPEESWEREIYNTLLSELQTRIQKYLPKDSLCAVTGATPLLPVASVRVNAILHTGEFLSAYKKGRADLIKDISSGGEDFAFSLRQKWITSTLSETQTNSGTADLIQKGMVQNQPYQYLQDFVAVESASSEDFLRIAKDFIPETPSLVVTSVDSKN